MMPDTTCSQCREHLAWYVAGRLDPDERAAVELHLAGCAACRRKAALWGAIAASLTEKDSHIPPDSHADSAWLALRDRLPRRSPASSQNRKADLLDVDTDARNSVSGHAEPRYQPRRSPRRPVLALAAAVALVGLAVALFGFFGAQLRQGKNPAVSATSTSAATSCAPNALAASLPPNAIVSSISMISPHDGWAVGRIEDNTMEHTMAPKTLILRFKDCRWQPFGESIPAAELYSVSMGSATEGWAVGATVKDYSVPQPGMATQHQWGGDKLFALHFADGQWQRVSLPSVVQGASGKVRMISASEGWMLLDVDKRHVDPYTVKYSYTLLHYQQSAWKPVSLTFDTSGTLMLWDIAAMTPDDCWIVGYGTAGDDFAVAQYHQGAWRTWSAAQLGVAYPALYAVTMAGPNDVWVAGSYPYQDASGDHTGPLALHYDGTTWTRENIGSAGDWGNDGEGDIMTIAALSPTDVWAFPYRPVTPVGSSYHMAHYHAGSWTWVAPPGDIIGINSAAFVSDSEGYATVLTKTHTGMETILYHYLNGVWSAIPSR